MKCRQHLVGWTDIRQSLMMQNVEHQGFENIAFVRMKLKLENQRTEELLVFVCITSTIQIL